METAKRVYVGNSFFDSLNEDQSGTNDKTIIVKESGLENSGRWDSFVLECGGASAYHLSAWRNVVESVFGHRTYYLYAENGVGEIIAILPLVWIKSRLFGSYMVSMPYFNYGGAVGVDADAEVSIIERAIDIARDNGAAHIEMRELNSRGSGWAVREDKISMVRELPAHPDELWKSIGSKCRAQIKRPAKEDATVIHGQFELLDEFYGVFSRNMRDLGTPVYPKEFFAEILKYFRKQTRIIVVRVKGAPVAAGFLIGFKKNLEIPWASSIREANPLGVNMLLYWEALKWGIESGYTTFDFGRSSKNSGTYKFKKQWGARERQLYWHYWLSKGQDIPQLNPNNPKYRYAISAWQRMPLVVANWLGPKIVRYLP